MTKALLNDYVEMTKPRIALMVLVTTALAYYLAGGGIGVPWVFAMTLLGTAMAGGGASVLNQFIERDVDAKMERTKNRPLIRGTISPQAALNFGVFLTVGGCLLLAWQVNVLAAFLALQSCFLYVLVYTPMKRLTWWNTTIGAVPGAIPPLIGWAAATGSLAPGAWILFAILFIWQHPHFFAIAWMFREDYARGGLRMLPVVHPAARATVSQMIGHTIVLIPVSLLPTLIGMSGWVYFAGALILGLGMLASGVGFSRHRTNASARRVLRMSLVYLPVLFLLIVLDSSPI